ncbi:MAG TPA: TlpA disulfide reductase family protein [Methylomirabilota bacterium]|nr:TlpA disulfide reductase family protein [Methylomirabilota bacterium]
MSRGLLALVLIALLLVAVGPAAAEDAAKELELSRPGRVQAAKPFEVPTPDGGRLSLADFRGRVVLLNFWATWCGPCKEEMPAMERLYQKHRAAGLVVVALSNDSEGSTQRVARFIKESGFTFPVGLDPRLKVASLYGVRVLPSSLVIDRKGHLTAIALGPREWDKPAAHRFFESLLK